MSRKRYLNRNSFSANLYCLFYSIEKNKLPRNTRIFKLKLGFAYALMLPLSVLLLPAVLFEYREYRLGLHHYGNISVTERFMMSLLVYAGFLGLYIIFLPFGLFFTIYTSPIISFLSKIGITFWGIVLGRFVLKLLGKLINLLFNSISNSKPIKEISKVENIEWQKPVTRTKDEELSDIMEEQERKFLKDRGWKEVEGDENGTRWIKQPYIQKPMVLADAYKAERIAFIAERVGERNKKK